MKRSATTAIDTLSSFVTTQKISFSDDEMTVQTLVLSEKLLKSMMPEVLSRLNNIARLLEEFSVDTKDYPELDRKEYEAKKRETGEVLRRTATKTAKTFYAERDIVRRAVFSEGIFRQLDSPKLRTHIELSEEGDSASDPFVSVALALHWNTKGLVFVLDRTPVGRASDILAGRYANATIVVGGYEVYIHGKERLSAIVAVPVKQSGMESTDIGQAWGTAVQTEPYVRSHGGVYPILADYCPRNIFNDRALFWIPALSDEIYRWVRYLKFLIELLPVAMEEKWEVKTF